jgi:diacylglycerol kinase (ATP)
VDACRIEYHPGPGDARSSAHFTCSASVGLGAAVATVANRRRRRLGDRAGTASAVVQAVLRSRAFELQTWIDGEHCVFPDARHAMVCKNPRIASGLRLDLDLDSGDGRGALVVVSGTGRLGLLRLLPRFYTGSAVGDPRVSVRHGAEFRLETSQPSALEFDGDPHGRTPARIKVLHQALRLIVPAMAPDDPRRDTP